MSVHTDTVPLDVVGPRRPEAALWRPLACLFAVAAIPVLVAPLSGGGHVYYLASQIAIWATFAMAYDLLLGFTGVVSFGHAVFFGVGSYAAAITYVRTGDTGLSLAISAVAGAATGALIGFAVVRTFGVAILLLTFAMGQAAWLVVMANPYGLTGGENGLPGVRPLNLFDLGPEISNYLLSVVLAVGVFVVLRVLTSMPFGDVLRGIRENEQRVAFLGFDTRAYKLVAFIISTTLSALAGGVNAFTLRQASPDDMQWLASADVMLFALLGGRGTLLGPACAAGVMILVRSVSSTYMTSWPLGIAAIYIAAALFLPNGIFAHVRWRRARSDDQ
jgi:branched-chain amino acid transport system permease protein